MPKVSVGKHAAVCFDEAGRKYLLLAEATLEAHNRRGEPDWTAIYFGPPEGAIEAVVRRSMDCHASLLKGVHGHLTPASYIRHWRDAMAVPSELPKGPLRVEFGLGGEQVEPALRPHLAQAFAGRGRTLDAAGDSFVIDTRDPGSLALIHEITTTRFPVGPIGCPVFVNRVFREIPLTARRSAKDGLPIPEPVKADLSGMEVFRYRNPVESFCLEAGVLYTLRGELRDGGCAELGDFIEQVALPGEREQPGFAEAAIKAFLAKLRFAPDLPASTTFTAVRDVPAGADAARAVWRATEVDRLAVRLGLPEGQARIEGTVGELYAAGLHWWDLPLRSRAMKFELRERVEPKSRKRLADDGKRLGLH